MLFLFYSKCGNKARDPDDAIADTKSLLILICNYVGFIGIFTESQETYSLPESILFAAYLVHDSQIR